MATAKQPGTSSRPRTKTAGTGRAASARRGAAAARSSPGDETGRGQAAGPTGAGAAAQQATQGDAAAAFGALFGSMPNVKMPPARLAELQAEYVQRWQRLFETASGHASPAVTDKRFAHESWHDSGPFTWTAALYMLNAEFLQKMAGALEGEQSALDRIRFSVQQWVDMMSPANFLATNPEAQRRLIETNGESLRAGLENLIADMQRGRMSQTDEEAFEVGRNVATSPGAVVYQNDLIQLIQYSPSTERVGARPLLMVPPSINKFYIMDLQPDNSLVAYAVSRGHTVFMVSWRNVGPEFGHLTWDDYLQQGVVEAIRVVREITGADTLNTLGFCVGGTILAAALAALAARGERPVETMTLMTVLLDFADPGQLGVFFDEASVRLREQTIGKGGILPGKDLATTFSFLRPNDLVWNYYVNNYLKGERPPAFDLLYWNADGTNLPGPMYAWYLRHMYLQNDLRIPDRLICLGSRSTCAGSTCPPSSSVRARTTSCRGVRRSRTPACCAAGMATCASSSAPADTSPGRSIRHRRTSAATGPTGRLGGSAGRLARLRHRASGQLVECVGRLARNRAAASWCRHRRRLGRGSIRRSNQRPAAM